MDSKELLSMLFNGYDNKIMTLRFVEHNTQEEVSSKLGIHKKMISRIEKRCIEQLKERKREEYKNE